MTGGSRWGASCRALGDYLAGMFRGNYVVKVRGNYLGHFPRECCKGRKRWEDDWLID